MLIGTSANCQGSYLKEWIGKQFLQATLVKNLNPEKVRFRHELDYSLSANCIYLINNPQGDDINKAGLCQNLKFKCSFNKGNDFTLSNVLIHNLGFQFYFDSIIQLNFDDNSLATRLDLKFSRNLTLSFNSNITSRLLNGFDYMMNDSGKQVKILNSAFLTPLTWTFSLGLGYTLVNFGSLNLGIAGAKLTYIRESEIFEIRGISNYVGIEKGKNHLFEYGMTFHLLIDKDLYKFLHWNCDLLFFKNFNAPVDMTFKNLFGVKINKFLKTSLSTKILYEEKLSKHLQVENLLSIGFNIHL